MSRTAFFVALLLDCFVVLLLCLCGSLQLYDHIPLVEQR